MRFDMICEANGITHRLTKPPPWTNGQVERMNRTIEDAAARRFLQDSHDRLRNHVAPRQRPLNQWRTTGSTPAAYNLARGMKTLTGLTPCEYISKIWTSEPDRFILDPVQQMPGLNN